MVFLPDKSLIISACSSKDPTALGFSFSFLLFHSHLVWPSLSVLFRPNFNIYFSYLSCPVLHLLCSHVLQCLTQLPIPVSFTYAPYFTLISVLFLALLYPSIFSSFISSLYVFHSLSFLGLFTAECLSWAAVCCCVLFWLRCPLSQQFFSCLPLIISCPLCFFTSLSGLTQIIVLQL